LGNFVRNAASFRLRRREDGYVLIALMLIVTMLVIAAAVAAPTIAFEIRRDREQEMIHRGVQYSRAIRGYYKKFGRYPTRLEDLDNTNNLRYLRKRYKDPLNKNQDFKLLHYGDPGVALNGGLGSFGGGSIPGANSVGAMNGPGAGSSPFGGSGSGSSFSQSSFSQSSGFGGNSNSSFGGSSGGGFGGSSNSGFGGSTFNNNSSNSGTSSSGSAASGTGTNQPGSTDSSQTGASTSGDSSSTQNGSTQNGSSGSNGQGNNQVFGGGPIVGVASLSKEKTIREFNKKTKYNDWQFVYDPSTDRGGLLTTPNQPQLQVGNQNLNGQNGQNGQPGSGGSSSSPFGTSSGSSFGQPTGFGNNPGPMGGTPNQAPSSPQQPQ
jgi:type II secretory pathway pseudopilin PulG